MTNQQIILGSLAMDLKRVALALHRNSQATAERFSQEALQRSKELENQQLSQHVQQLLIQSRKPLIDLNKKDADDILMYSTLFQNLAIRKYINRNK